MATQTVYCRDSAGVVHARADVSWKTGSSTVTVNVTYLESNSWRIKPQGSNTSPVLTVTNGSTSGTFTAVDGQTYVFQTVMIGSWSNSYDGSSNFTVNFSESGGSSGGNTGGDDDDDGDASGGNTGVYPGGDTGGSEYGAHQLLVKAGEGFNITVTRVFTGNSYSYIGQLVDGEIVGSEQDYWYSYEIWPTECFVINAEAQDGYTLTGFAVNGLVYDEQYAEYVFPGDYEGTPTVWASASPGIISPTTDGFVVIGNRSKSAKYRPYKYVGSEWIPLDGLGQNASEKVASGTARSTVNGVSISCGFSPDFVLLTLGENLEDEGMRVSTAAAFEAEGETELALCSWSVKLNKYIHIVATKTTDGFQFSAWDTSGNVCSETFTYKAVKYT